MTLSSSFLHSFVFVSSLFIFSLFISSSLHLCSCPFFTFTKDALHHSFIHSFVHYFLSLFYSFPFFLHFSFTNFHTSHSFTCVSSFLHMYLLLIIFHSLSSLFTLYPIHFSFLPYLFCSFPFFLHSFHIHKHSHFSLIHFFSLYVSSFIYFSIIFPFFHSIHSSFHTLKTRLVHSPFPLRPPGQVTP